MPRLRECWLPGSRGASTPLNRTTRFCSNRGRNHRCNKKPVRFRKVAIEMVICNHSGEELSALNVVARDGIEPPTPAFSGPPTELAKWFEISASS